ncbi:tRNA (cytidine(34)-2'-O)-methyltransferase [Helcococcus ovis]|uniref:Putative tRNA (cytidine(34)-2'-O)-methyltransferase n=1 Tax=Helcococcus ovis TaxID=72026 RepID=A0A4R9C2A7_9FIRM|nr:tRNA (cytidine(34)-2'-O)-methyltransferase [Helcococcus ovis]TFF64422.1 tRNA (cytidine(34)-2'-O)-methyltransferase [Helcococcus ovis]TFF65783.1 tRNA (cytidine(34)-2'-O)-methyltransferase [Helcococcus ovis]TFF68921.1 tRNA (cytidine(34)-2'-O)-methyltransferase [Helcococcus ovis]WNZ00647.1 tRNA (cytidine(34)-2'-O)-methyltransferase [Helcococcus ovis]
MLNIVLFEPEIAGNTANIGRTCYLTNTRLHLIRPLGFMLNDKMMRRAGLDYWEHVDIVLHDSFEDFMEYKKDARVFLATTHATKFHTDVEYKDGDYIMFGSESKGVYEYIHNALVENGIKIPMREDSDRSLNLCNSANIILYEAFRQLGFEHMN